jgi:2-methylcitrate dehydratase PrpD
VTEVAVSPTASQTLARWVVDLRFEDLPEDVVDVARALLLDHLGCAARGSTVDTAQSVARALAALGARDEGARTVVVGREPARIEWAIFANGVHAHSIELDDTHNASSLHPAVVTWPAALAVAELTGASGAELLTAGVAGYEVACRLGRALVAAETYRKGFHPTAVVAPFAAAAAAGKLLGLDADRLAHAFGIAASQAAGRMEFLVEGAWTKRFHPGWGSHAGYVAARLAEAGFTGPTRAFEGKDGVVGGYGSREHLDLVTADLGRPFELLVSSVKPHACCRYNQGPIDLAISLAASHDLVAADVARATVGVVTPALSIVAEPRERKLHPTNDVDAQFSLPYAIGLGVVHRRASLDEYSAAVLSDPDVLAVAARTTVEARPHLDVLFPERWPAELEIETVEGRVLRASTQSPKGDPDNRLTPDEARAKFRALAGAALDEASLDAVERAVAGIAEAENVDELVAALAGAGVR